MTLKLIGIGALGNMLSPAAKHLKNSPVARFVRILDRGVQSATHNDRRQAWQEYGAQLVSNLSLLVGDGKFDGVIICAGKNGDDHKIFLDLIPLLHKANPQHPYFILHLSTVSAAFVQKTKAYCAKYDIQYVNYPLTGGAKGAATAQMLILASGPAKLYQRLQPFLQLIGVPKYFGTEDTNGAAVKLIGHVLVFHGLLGISLASLLHKNAFHLPALGGKIQTDFFDFLNNGAGGTKQWDAALRPGIADDNWTAGFLVRHAVVDLIYAITLMQEKNVPTTLLLPCLEIALLFTYLLRQEQNQNLATQAFTRMLASTPKAEIDAFLKEHLSLNSTQCLQNCITLLPSKIRASIALEIDYPD